MNDVPWQGAANLTRLDVASRERTLVAEGTLAQMLHIIEIGRGGEHTDMRIALPERNSAPFGYTPPDFPDLLERAHRPRHAR